MQKIAEHLHRLGDADHSCFLLTGTDRSVLIDAGPAYMAPVYRQEIRALLGRSRAPDLLLLSHFHYDHTGGAPYLLRHFPVMQTAGSAKLDRLLNKKRIAASLAEFNRSLLAGHLPENDILPGDLDYNSLSVDRVLEDGAELDLGGGVAIEAMAAPGHSTDNLSFWLPHAEAVIAAEAVGIIPGDDFWVAPQFLSSYEDYLDTIERVRRRRPKIVVPGHHRVVEQKDIDRFFEAALADCRQYREMVEQYLQEAQMREETVVHRIVEQQVRSGRRGKQPEDAFRSNIQIQVKVIARRIRQGKQDR